LIEQVMIFALGFLVSGLLALLFLPAFWRRALRLSRRRLEMLTPLSMEEILAERDQLRAQAAVDLRRAEQKLERLTEERAGLMSEIGRRTALIARVEGELGTRSGDLRDRDGELKAAWAELGAMHADSLDLGSRLTKATADLAALRGEEGRLREDFDALRIEKAALRTSVDHLQMQGEQLRQRLDAAQVILDEREAQARGLADERDRLGAALTRAQARLQALESGSASADGGPWSGDARVILHPVMGDIDMPSLRPEAARADEDGGEMRKAAVS